MDPVSHQQRSPPTTNGASVPLPSIASLTNDLRHPDQSPGRLPHQSEAREARDSGNWSISQSQRECPYERSPARVFHAPSTQLLTGALGSSAVSNTMGLQVQTLLNPEESPSRNSVPGTPSLARYPSGVSQQVRQ